MQERQDTVQITGVQAIETCYPKVEAECTQDGFCTLPGGGGVGQSASEGVFALCPIAEGRFRDKPANGAGAGFGFLGRVA